MISWWGSGDNRHAGIAGLAAGLCFASKQNIGTAALLAVITTVAAAKVWRHGGTDLRYLSALASVCVAFAITVAVSLAPVALTGGIPGLLDYGFVAKGKYLSLGGASYFQPLTAAAAATLHPLRPWSAHTLIQSMPFIAAPAVATGLAAVWAAGRSEARGVATIVLLFFCAAAVALYPRADAFHMVFVVPAMLVAASYTVRGLRRLVKESYLNRLASFTRAVVALSVFFLVARAAVALVWPRFVWSTIPHVGWVRLEKTIHGRLSRNIKAVAELPRDGRTLILGGHAAFYYLTTGTRNPSAFDYPYVTTFGTRGEPALIESIRSGEVLRVCIDPTGEETMMPHRLNRVVVSEMTLVRSLPFCPLYQRGDFPRATGRD